MRLRRITLFPVLAAVLLALASGRDRAADDFKGWFLYLDLADTKPNSLDQHFANNVDAAANHEELLYINNSYDISARIGEGYSWGKMGSLRVSYWNFNNEDKESGSRSGALIPTVFGYGAIYAYQFLNNATFTATGKVQASTYDVDYARPFSVGEKTTISWMAGLRVARFEETRTFSGSDATNTYVQEKHFTNKGWGPRIGVNVDWGFTRTFSLAGTAAFSFMQAKSDGEASQAQPGIKSESLSVSDDSLRGLIMDFDLRGVWTIGNWGIWAGYEMSDWGGIATDPFPGASSFVGPMTPRGREDVSFNSFHGGVSWRFGKGS
jgi:hypothetical protein